jgi:DNA relaxase NicK
MNEQNYLKCARKEIKALLDKIEFLNQVFGWNREEIIKAIIKKLEEIIK